MIDIGSASTFEEIVKIKKEAYRININSGINIERILSGLYTNPTHFIFELMQNAGSIIGFKLTDDCVNDVQSALNTLKNNSVYKILCL